MDMGLPSTGIITAYIRIPYTYIHFQTNPYIGMFFWRREFFGPLEDAEELAPWQPSQAFGRTSQSSGTMMAFHCLRSAVQLSRCKKCATTARDGESWRQRQNFELSKVFKDVIELKIPKQNVSRKALTLNQNWGSVMQITLTIWVVSLLTFQVTRSGIPPSFFQ